MLSNFLIKKRLYKVGIHLKSCALVKRYSEILFTKQNQ